MNNGVTGVTDCTITGSAGGGGFGVATGTGTDSNFTTSVTSPTYALSFHGQMFRVLSNGATSFVIVDTITNSGLLVISSANASFVTYSYAASNFFLLSSSGTLLTTSSATANYVQGSSASVTYAFASVTLTNSSATLTYLQNSSAAVTYAGINVDLSKTSATVTYLQNSSATVTYVQGSSASVTYAGINVDLSKASATVTYLQNSSATVTYVQGSSASVTYAGINVDLSKSSATATYIQQSTATNGIGQLVRLDGAGKLPAIDGSQLTNLPSSGGGGSGYIDVQSKGVDQTKRSTMNFTGNGVTVSDIASVTTINIPGVTLNPPNISSTSSPGPGYNNLSVTEVIVATVTITPSTTSALIRIDGNLAIIKDAGTTAKNMTLNLRRGGQTDIVTRTLISSGVVVTSYIIASTTVSLSVFGYDFPNTIAQTTYTLSAVLSVATASASVRNLAAVEMGAAGPTGPTGATGATGAAGNTGTFAEWNSIDYAISTTSNTFYTTIATVPAYGQMQFWASASTAANGGILKWFADDKFDTATDLIGSLGVIQSSADASAQAYVISIASAQSGVPVANATFGNDVVVLITSTTAAAWAPMYSSTFTLTGWKSFIAPAVHYWIRIARQGNVAINDPSDTPSYFEKFYFKYGRSS